MKKSEFRTILKIENKKIFNYLLRVLRHREDAEDVLQETFISFYHKMENVDAKLYRSYLFTTAYHKALNVIKVRKKKEQTANLDHIAEEIAEDNSSKNDMVKKCLQQLSPEDAFIIELQFYQKMSYKEIAKVLKCTVSAVDSRLVRAKRKLKKNILQYKAKNNV